ADLDSTAPVPLLLAVVIKRELVGPAVVRLPGGVGTLEDKISRTIIADDEDHIALEPVAQGRQFSQINAADPIARNCDRCAGLPCTIAQAPFADGRIGLNAPLERPKVEHVPATSSAVKAHSINIELETRGW